MNNVPLKGKGMEVRMVKREKIYFSEAKKKPSLYVITVHSPPPRLTYGGYIPRSPVDA